MMVETILESPTDLGMSNGVLPQWKRELLQRRAARHQPPRASPAPPAPSEPPAPSLEDEDEELRYGPGIVKRLKSRYLSLALREAPRRRPSVLRRAASLELLLDARPPPAPRARPRPASALLQPSPPPNPARREHVKRARSVDALSRLASLEDPAPEPPSAPPPPPPPPPPAPETSPPAPTSPRGPRPPRRPAPLLRDAERPPPDVVRSTLRKFESAPARRAAPAARVSAVLRGLGARAPSSPPAAAPTAAPAPAPALPPPAFCSTPEPRARSPSPLGGARGSHLPPLAAANPVLLGRARRVGVIRPMPAPALERPSAPPPDVVDKAAASEPEPRADSPPPEKEAIAHSPHRDGWQIADILERFERRSPTPEPERRTAHDGGREATEPPTNGLENPPRETESRREKSPTPEPVATTNGKRSRISTAKIERGWSEGANAPSPVLGVRLRGAGARPEAGGTSIVFNFSSRKEIPDYIENDGLVLKTSRRDKLKAGDPGVVALRPDAGGGGGGGGGSSDEEAGEGEGEEAEARAPSPCSVRFVNDNVLINGRSSLAAAEPAAKLRQHKLKLQFDDSLTVTFEYPSESSLVDDDSPPCALPNNTLLGRGAEADSQLGSYRPHGAPAAFQLGLAPPPPPPPPPPSPPSPPPPPEPALHTAPLEPLASFSHARLAHTDLLF